LSYYIVLTRQIAKTVQVDSEKKPDRPQTDMKLLANSLGASFIVQPSLPIGVSDYLQGKFHSTPENWAFARYVVAQLKPGDVVFCPGEEIGVPLAKVCQSQVPKFKIIVWFHRITGLKSRLALKIFRICSLVDLAVVSSESNKQFLLDFLNFKQKQVLFWRHPTDCNFFVPKNTTSERSHSCIASVGLEQRDYRLLAAATEQLNVEVKVAGFSQFQSRNAKCFPPVMPANMSNKWYGLSELLQLYHDADIVVIPLQDNPSAAGITTLLEAMACQKPIICTRTRGLAPYLQDDQAIVTVKPGNLADLKKAIKFLLDNPDYAQAMAKKAYKLVNQEHNLANQVPVLANFIKTKSSLLV